MRHKFEPPNANLWLQVPDMDDLMNYARRLEHRLSCMRRTPLNTSASPSTTANTSFKTSAFNSNTSTSRPNCTLCNEVHRLNRCSVFLEYDVARKQKYLKSKKGCSNCLSLNLNNSQCPPFLLQLQEVQRETSYAPSHRLCSSQC